MRELKMLIPSSQWKSTKNDKWVFLLATYASQAVGHYNADTLGLTLPVASAPVDTTEQEHVPK